MYNPDLMAIKNEKAREEKKTALGLVGVETLAKMEDEVLEDEDGAKKSCSRNFIQSSIFNVNEMTWELMKMSNLWTHNRKIKIVKSFYRH